MQIVRRNLLRAAGTLGAAFMLPAAAANAQSVDVAELMAEGPLPDMIIGAEDAPITMIEYASMTCIHCANFHTEIYPALKEKYIDTGKVRLVFREFPLDRLAAAASMLGRCLDEGKFFPFIDAMFTQRNTWVVSGDAIKPLFAIVRQAGFTQETFTQCLTNQELLDGVVAMRKRGGEVFGVDSTPTFFINGEKTTGVQSLEALEEAVCAAFAELGREEIFRACRRRAGNEVLPPAARRFQVIR